MADPLIVTQKVADKAEDVGNKTLQVLKATAKVGEVVVADKIDGLDGLTDDKVAGLMKIAKAVAVATADGEMFDITVDKITFTADGSSLTTADLGSGEFQPLDDDLTAIAALAGTEGLLRKTAANTWSLDVNAYITAAGAPVQSVAGRTGTVTLTSTDVGLGNVENKSSATIRSEITSGNVTTALGYTPWHAGNDGSGTGLDADLLDNLHASDLVQVTGNQDVAGIKTFTSRGRFNTTETAGNGNPVVDIQGCYLRIGDGIAGTSLPDGIGIKFHDSGVGHASIVFEGGTGLFKIGSSNGVATLGLDANPAFSLNLSSGLLSLKGNTVWHTGNDGASSGLDADLLDGLQATAFHRADLFTQYFNPWAQSKYYSSITTNRFLGRGNKLYVTVDSVPNNYAGIANGDFEDVPISWAAGAPSSVVNVNFVTNGLTSANGFTYSSGYITLHFYPGAGPASPPTVRVKNKDGVWTDLGAMTAWSGVGAPEYQIHQSVYNWVTDFEFTITPQPAGQGTWLTEIEFHGERMGIAEGPLMTIAGGTFYNTVNVASGSLQVAGQSVWHPGNDGAGTGLDADLLDGQHGSYYTDIVSRLGYTPSPRRDFSKTVQPGELYRLGYWTTTENTAQLLITVSNRSSGHSGTAIYLVQGGYSWVGGTPDTWYRLVPLSVGNGHGEGSDDGVSASSPWQVFAYPGTGAGNTGVAIAVPEGVTAKILRVGIIELRNELVFTDQSSTGAVTGWASAGTRYSSKRITAEALYGPLTGNVTGNLTGNASSASSVPWAGVTDPPATYAPSAHTHPVSEVTNAVTTNTVQSITSSKSFFANVGMGEMGTATGDGVGQEYESYQLIFYASEWNGAQAILKPWYLYAAPQTANAPGLNILSPSHPGTGPRSVKFEDLGDGTISLRIARVDSAGTNSALGIGSVAAGAITLGRTGQTVTAPGNLTVQGTLTGTLTGNASSATTATTASNVPWAGVTDPPATYAPSAHTHPGDEITTAVANATDADTLDTLHASSFMQLSAIQEVSGTKTFLADQVWGSKGIAIGDGAGQEFNSYSLKFVSSEWSGGAAVDRIWEIYSSPTTTAQPGLNFKAPSYVSGIPSVKFRDMGDGTAHIQAAAHGPAGATSVNVLGYISSSGTAIACKIGNTATLSATGAKIVSFYNDNVTTEKAYIDKDGLGYFAGGIALAASTTITFNGVAAINNGVLATDAAHGSRGGGSLHSAATGGADGFMSSTDKNKVDGITSAASTAVLAFGAATGPLANQSAYIRPGGFSGATVATDINRLPLPRAGTIESIYVRGSAASIGGSTTFTLVVNGVDSANTITIADSASPATGNLTGIGLSCSAGDELSIKITGNAGVATGFTNPIVTLDFTA